MKKIFILTLILLLSFTLISRASTQVKVVVDTKLITFPDAQPFINGDDRTLVPVRFIAENLDCEVSWNGFIRQVGIEGRGKNIKLNIGENKASVDGEEIEFDTESIIKDNRTFVPLRFVSEALGAEVQWDNFSKSVIIQSEKKEVEVESKVVKVGDKEFNVTNPELLNAIIKGKEILKTEGYVTERTSGTNVQYRLYPSEEEAEEVENVILQFDIDTKEDFIVFDINLFEPGNELAEKKFRDLVELFPDVKDIVLTQLDKKLSDRSHEFRHMDKTGDKNRQLGLIKT